MLIRVNMLGFTEYSNIWLSLNTKGRKNAMCKGHKGKSATQNGKILGIQKKEIKEGSIARYKRNEGRNYTKISKEIIGREAKK